MFILRPKSCVIGQVIYPHRLIQDASFSLPKPFRKFLFRLFCISLIIFAKILIINSTACAESLDEIIDSVQAQYDSATTIKGYFKQTSYLKTYKREQLSTGKVYLKKPGKMRWEYNTPEKQIIVSDGMILWFYIPEDRQAMKKNLKGELDTPSEPYLFLMGQARLRDIFDIQKGNEASEGKERYYLTLRPKTPQANMKKMILGINKENFLVEETRLIDYFGNITSVIISEMKTGMDIPDKMFQFTPPNGVRIIEQERN